MIVLYILLAIFIFGFMIFIHELGHFMFAKLFKVTINEFSIGMGPKILSKKAKDGVTYSLRLLPLGGFVSMAGEDEESDDPNAFNKKSAWKRFIIVAAGAMMNLLVGIIVMTILTASSSQYGTTKIKVEENSQSALYFQDYDEIIKIGNVKVHTSTELGYEIMRQGYKEVDVTVIRDGKEVVIEDVQFKTTTSQGVAFGAVDFKVFPEERNFGTVVKNTYYSCKSTIKMVYDSLIDLISGRYGIEHVSGPVGVTEAITEAAQTDVYSLFYLIVVISINLGIFNLLPIPALDGGSLLLLFVEMIIRRPIPQKVEYIIKAVGFALIMGLAVIILLKDIIYLFK